MKRKLLALLLTAALLLPCIGRADDVSLPKGYTAVAENDRFLLGLNTSNCFFCIADKKLGEVYSSNPSDWKTDKLAQGANKTRLQSQLILTVLRESGMLTETVNSQQGSVSKGTVKLLKLENGLCIRYTFEQYGITVPLYVTINEDSFDISIPAEEIIETGGDRVLNVTIAPMFACAGSNEDGYILLPDGSGSLMYFDNGKGKLGQYQAQVYGRDAGFLKTMDTYTSARVMLPVYGFSFDDYGLLAVVHEGDTHAWVNARPSGGTDHYTSACFSFTLRASDEYTIGEESVTSHTVDLYQAEKSTSGSFCVRWYPLEKGENSWLGMADKLGKLLFDMRTTEAEPSVLLSLYGEIYKQLPFLGIPIEQSVALTTYRQARMICDDLGGNGVPLLIRYKNASDEMARERGGELSVSSHLGGKKELMELTGSNIPVWFTGEVLRFSTQNALLSRFTDGAKRLSGLTLEESGYRINTHKADDALPSYYRIKADKTAEVLSAFASSAQRLGVMADAGNAANTLYSDFSCEDGGREQIASAAAEFYRQLRSRQRVFENAPNAYAMPYADYIGDVPVESSAFSVTDETVPFYAFVLRGRVPGSVTAVNGCDEPRRCLLYAMETGLDLDFRLIYENEDQLRFSDFNDLYGCRYEDNRDTILSMYAELKQVRTDTDGKAVLAYENTESLVSVAYEDGTVLDLNFSADMCSGIEPLGWRLTKGESK